MQYGMITYAVPLKRYPIGYLGKSDTPVPFVSLASQKNHMAIYMMCLYGRDEESFRKKYLTTGLKLDMGKCCLRFRKLEDLALDVVCEEIAAWPVQRFLEKYEAARGSGTRKPAGSVRAKSTAKTKSALAPGKSKGAFKKQNGTGAGKAKSTATKKSGKTRLPSKKTAATKKATRKG